MSVACTRTTDESTPTTTRSSNGAAPTHPSRDALVLEDPATLGYAVVLPPVTADLEAAIHAISLQTPFLPVRRPENEPTAYDSVDEFLAEHPHGETLRPILKEHFDY